MGLLALLHPQARGSQGSERFRAKDAPAPAAQASLANAPLPFGIPNAPAPPIPSKGAVEGVLGLPASRSDSPCLKGEGQRPSLGALEPPRGQQAPAQGPAVAGPLDWQPRGGRARLDGSLGRGRRRGLGRGRAAPLRRLFPVRGGPPSSAGRPARAAPAWARFRNASPPRASRGAAALPAPASGRSRGPRGAGAAGGVWPGRAPRGRRLPAPGCAGPPPAPPGQRGRPPPCPRRGHACAPLSPRPAASPTGPQQPRGTRSQPRPPGEGRGDAAAAAAADPRAAPPLCRLGPPRPGPAQEGGGQGSGAAPGRRAGGEHRAPPPSSGPAEGLRRRPRGWRRRAAGGGRRRALSRGAASAQADQGAVPSRQAGRRAGGWAIAALGSPSAPQPAPLGGPSPPARPRSGAQMRRCGGAPRGSRWGRPTPAAPPPL
uniref:basic proline-rich protein-like n=1 Tax=Euleptes europaea TaxID=460621 RepID=UPI0025403670|nr:basic proline-rich protein-like [Euleptes europaea]